MFKTVSTAEAHKPQNYRSEHFKGRYKIYNIVPHNALNNTKKVGKNTQQLQHKTTTKTYNLTKNDVNCLLDKFVVCLYLLNVTGRLCLKDCSYELHLYGNLVPNIGQCFGCMHRLICALSMQEISQNTLQQQKRN